MILTRGKGIFAALAISTALLVPAAAATAASSYSSTADSSAAAQRAAAKPFNVGFTSLTRNGRVVAVKDFKFSGVNATCKVGGSIDVSGRAPRMSVNSRKFHSTVRKNGGRVRVNGTFRKHGAKVVGRIRVNGKFHNGNARGCVGVRAFTAGQN